MKRLLPIAVSLTLSLAILLISVTSIAAAALALTGIGTVDVTGKSYSTFTYTGENPTLEGVAEASEVVTISIDAVEDTVTTDATGAWSYVPTSLTEGEHDLIISAASATSDIEMTITIEVAAGTGGSSDASESAVPDDLPESGIATPTLMLLGGAALLIGMPVYAFAKSEN